MFLISMQKKEKWKKCAGLTYIKVNYTTELLYAYM